MLSFYIKYIFCDSERNKIAVNFAFFRVITHHAKNVFKNCTLNVLRLTNFLIYYPFFKKNGSNYEKIKKIQNSLQYYLQYDYIIIIIFF